MIEKIKNEYMKSLKPENTEEFFDIYLYRPIAFLFVKMFNRTNISPNIVTMLGMIWGILAGYFLSRGIYPYILYGAIFYQFGNIFDCADGQLARIKNSFSTFGRILDGFVDYFNVSAVYIGAYVGFLKSGIFLHREHFILLIMIIASISTILTSVVYDKIRTKYIDFIEEKKMKNLDGKNIQNIDTPEEIGFNIKSERNFFKKILYFLYLQYYEFQNFITKNLSLTKVKKNSVLYENKQLYIKLYLEKNALLLKLWGIVGPSAHAFYFFIFAIYKKLFLYFIFISTVLNVIFLILSIVHILNNRIIIIELKENKNL